jgi:threonylcarbamoyladenosine tRNA methylthiotransferase MtaB
LEEEITLLDAINAVSEVEGIKRVRLGSLEQGIMTEEFVKVLAENKKFCPHFHLSLQSGSAETLKRMNRHYTPEQYRERCDIIRKYFKKPAFTTDVIVGFPGETAEEFAETKKFLKDIAFAEMHIFKYSKRQGTLAEKMENQVDDNTKAHRSEELIALGEQLKECYRSSFVGEEKEVLMEETMIIDGDEYFVGHTMEYLKVAAKTSEDLTNHMCDVSIKKLMNNEILLAELVKIY